jgi:hypothetical protein
METNKEADLKAKSKEDKALRDLVWAKPNFEGFYIKHSRTLRRIVQLCDKECALKHAELGSSRGQGRDRRTSRKNVA